MNNRASSRDLIVDVSIVALLLAWLLIDSETGEHGTGITLLGVICALGATVPLLWRRSSPVMALVLITPFVFLTNMTLESFDAAIFSPMIALFSVARYGDRRRSLVIGAAIVPIVVAGVAVTGAEVISGITVINLSFVLLGLVAGDALRSREAAAADLLQRRQLEQRELEAEADRRVAAERLQIAREVHDVVAHTMVAINVQAGTAAHLLESHPEQAEAALREIKRVSGAALTDLRATLSVLREPDASAPTRPAGRLLQLGELVQPLEASGVAVDVHVDGSAGEVSPAVGAAAYRIVQEALTNVVRHAGANHAQVRVGVDGSILEVEVLDNGSGETTAESAGGNGLRGMRERASAIGGIVESGRRPGGGWRVHATLPVRATSS